MTSALFESVAGIANFSIYFVTSVALVGIFCALYIRITPFSEYKLIKAGKKAPAISYGGAILGFVIPLASAIAHSVSFLDMLIWAGIAFIVQIITFFIVRLTFSSLVQDIEKDSVAAAILLAVFSLAGGVLNAACMTY
jgi:putative membrane protein